jgi:proteic killer suppression protein
MWAVIESSKAIKILDALPQQVIDKYDVWLGIVKQSGPRGLRAIKGFHDEKLSGKLAGYRSSRLSVQWRVISRTEADVVTVHVDRITPHVYR